MRPPHIGWLVVILAQLCVLAVAAAAIEHQVARHKIAQVNAVLDSLGVIQCVPYKPGQPVRIFPVPRDSLKRAR